MITIDFSLFLEDVNINIFLNFLKREYKALTSFKSSKALLYSDLIEIKNNQTDINLCDKQIKWIGFIIEKNENLFYKIYSEYKILNNLPFEEKLLYSVNMLQELLGKTNLPSIRKFIIHMRFLNDFKGYLIFEKKNNNKLVENQYLNEIIEFKSLFNNNSYTFFLPQILSKYNLIYIYRNGEIELKNKNLKSELTLILVVLEVEKKIYKVEKRIWNEIMKKCINVTVNESFFSQKLNDYKNGSVTNVEDEERILNIKSFLNEMLKSTKIY